MNKKIKKSQVKESEYVVNKDNFDDIKTDLNNDLEDDDVIKIVDDEEMVDEEVEPIDENVRAIITKGDLIKTIKESRNAK